MDEWKEHIRASPCLLCVEDFPVRPSVTLIRTGLRIGSRQEWTWSPFCSWHQGPGFLHKAPQEQRKRLSSLHTGDPVMILDVVYPSCFVG